MDEVWLSDLNSFLYLMGKDRYFFVIKKKCKGFQQGLIMVNGNIGEIFVWWGGVGEDPADGMVG